VWFKPMKYHDRFCWPGAGRASLATLVQIERAHYRPGRGTPDVDAGEADDEDGPTAARPPPRYNHPRAIRSGQTPGGGC